MLSLILLLIGGSIISFLSLQNTMVVSVNFLDYTVPNIPLFYVIIGSMLTGLLLAYVIHLVNSVFTFFTIYDKNKKIMDERKEVDELTKKVHQLELENDKLKKEVNVGSVDEESL